MATAKELNSRAWTTKCWTTRSDKRRGGSPFHKANLFNLLTNPIYIGKVRHKDEVYEGEHAAILDESTFESVQEMLSRNGVNGGREVRNKHGAILSGILRCSACDCAMSHSFTTKGKRRYRYYVCSSAQKSGWDTCPAPSVPAGEIERFVVDEMRAIGQDTDLVAATLAATRDQLETAIDTLTRERAVLERQRRDDEAELGRLARHGADDRTARELADLQERIGRTDRRLTNLGEEIIELSETRVGEDEVAAALAEFDGLWAQLTPREQARVIRLLVERIDHDGEQGKLRITFRPTGIKLLANEEVLV